MARPSFVGGVSQGSNGQTQSRPPPPLLSECRSDHSNEAGDPDLLSPPETPSELEDLPYRSCCSSSESLNMSQRGVKEHGHNGHKETSKINYFRENGKIRLHPSLQYQKNHENEISWFNGLPDSQTSLSKITKSEYSDNGSGNAIGSINIPKSMAKAFENDHKDYSLQPTPSYMRFAKKRRNLVGHEAKTVPVLQLQIITAERKGLNFEYLLRNTKMQGYRELNFNKTVRKSLTSLKTLPPLPASITLSRPNETSPNKEDKITSLGDLETDFRSHLGQPRRCNQPALHSTSLEEIDLATKTSQLHSPKQMPPDGINFLTYRESLVEHNTRRTSVVIQGVTSQPSIPAARPIAPGDVRQLDARRHITLGQMKRPSLRRSKNFIKTPRTSVYEIIWEGNQPLSRCSISTTSVSNEVCCGSISRSNSIKLEWHQNILGRLCDASYLLAMTLKKRSNASKLGVVFPTEPVAQRILSNVARKARESPDISPTQSLSSLSNPAPDTNQENLSNTAQLNFAGIADGSTFSPQSGRKSMIQWQSPLPDISAPEFEVVEGELPDCDIQVCRVAHKTKSDASYFGAVEQRISVERLGLRNNALNPDTKALGGFRSASLLHPQLVPRLWLPVKPGSAIGCSSGVQRKNSAHSIHVKIDKESLIHRSQEGESTWVKYRKDSGCPPARTPSSGKTSIMESSGELSLPNTATPREVQKVRKMEEDRLKLVEGLAPLLSKVDHAGIYGKMTGSIMDTARCEDSCTPHICGESRYGSRVPSRDWIG